MGLATSGVVVRAWNGEGGALAFVPAAIAIAVLPLPETARLPGAPPELLGVTVHRGEAIPVVTVGGARTSMLVCTYLGETFGLVGFEVVATGRFPLAEGPSLTGERVLFEGEPVPPFDVAATFARVFGADAAQRPPRATPQAG